MQAGRAIATVRIGELSRRTGVSPELLRAWEQRYGLLQPARSAGGFRLYSDQDERRVRTMTALIAQGISAAEAAGRALSDEPIEGDESGRPMVDDLTASLERALDTFDDEAAHTAFDRLLAGVSVETLLHEVVLPYLHRLGERWERGDVTIAQEHFASNLVRGRLLGLARGWGEGSGPPVVLACPPGEEHDLALIVFGIAAGRRGRRIVFLGADTPIETLLHTARTTHPSGVVLAVSRREPLDQHAEALRALVGEVTVWVAGEGAVPDAVEAIGARMLEGDPVEAAKAFI